jgi:hypothetical protein
MRREICINAAAVTILVATLVLVGCALKARIYNLDTGQVLVATFNYSGSGKGPIEITLPSGEVCKGEYLTVAGGSMAWGSVFATVYGPAGSATATDTGYSGSIENKQKGSAIVTGNQGTVVECEYVTTAAGAEGYGACKDNKGNRYKLMF